jgi:hypothetical protein
MPTKLHPRLEIQLAVYLEEDKALPSGSQIRLKDLEQVLNPVLSELELV